MFLLKRIRRRSVRSREFPSSWQILLHDKVPHYRMLPLDDRARLHGHIQVFLAEKQFEGALGLTVTDEMRLTVAAQACLLILRRGGDYFPQLSSIIIYPGEFVARRHDVDEGGVVTVGEELRSGESWEGGSLVLSWEDVLAAGRPGEDDYNVVIHEFAHQLDAEEGITALLESGRNSSSFGTALLQAYEGLCADLESGRETVFDPYGAESVPEFFAVASECFFSLPGIIREYHPDLYAHLQAYYRLDPSAWQTV
ncbi:M90 family metallopeptidase [Geobacter argillaceus]|uniref:Zinc-dependent peptidase n=1 Tax=Geobacter argillaceus TaxID=345631 RepID=A0A562VI11_9BACT|nr:M90 family metallopeptidase [Geobacter argillaceus]TWJ17555.1 hypothetical protein JN12_02950 [Geobacter argillaceus]